MLTAVSTPEPIPHVPCEEYIEGRRAWKNGLPLDAVDRKYPRTKGGHNWKRKAWFDGYFDAKYEWKFGKAK